MESQIEVAGLLGPAEEQPAFSTEEKTEKADKQIANVQVSISYPNTGEQQNQYLIFSGICILLLLLVLKKRKTTD